MTSNTQFTESIVEEATLAWLEGLGYDVFNGPDIAAGELGAERSDTNYRDVVFEGRLRQALAWLHSILPAETIDNLYQVTLAALRDTLLPRLISGELRVKDADRIFARSA